MAPDGTATAASIRTLARNDVVADTIKIVSYVAAGPDGRLRPVPRPSLRPDPAGRLLPPPGHLRAGLRLEELAARRRRGWSRSGPTTTAQQAAAVEAELQKIDERAAGRDGRRSSTTIFEKEVAKLPEEQRELARDGPRHAAEASARPSRSSCCKDHPSLNVSRGSAVPVRPQGGSMSSTRTSTTGRRELQAKRPAEDFVAVPDRSARQDARRRIVFYRGDIDQPRAGGRAGRADRAGSRPAAEIPADDPQLPTTGRRLAFAR